MSHIVVIGYGMVGSRFVEDLTAADHAGEHLVTVLGNEACEPYNRVLLSDVVAGTRGLSAIALPAPDHPRVTVQRGVAVRAIDRGRRDVVLADDTRVPYDELVIATGAAARVPTVPGLADGPGRGDLPSGVHVLRSIDDAREIIEELRRAGGGFSAAELDRARAQMKAGMLMGLESPSGQAERIARALAIWGRVPDAEEVAQRIDAVTAAEVRDHAAGLIAAARPALALYGPVRRGPSREALAERLAA